MSNCSNCFNGCVQITSDQCVKYTGPTIASLGIETGTSLAAVEEAITDFLLTVLDGTGILPTIDSNILCTLVSDNMPVGDATLNDLLTTLINVACDLDARITLAQDELDDLNSAYEVDCLSVDDNTDTHAVIQAIIDNLCALNTTVQNLDASLANYVQLADLNNLIDTHLSAGTVLMYEKMVPYTVVEYYGALGGYPGVNDGFSVDGTGYGAWEKVYLCNGNNGTPDKRNRVGIGASEGVGGGAMDADRASLSTSLGLPGGLTKVALTNASQLPSHIHSNTISVTLADHTHFTVGNSGNNKVLNSAYPIKIDELGSENENYRLAGTDLAGGANVGKTSASKSDVIATITNTAVGSSVAHDNMPPYIPCFYIMYRP